MYKKVLKAFEEEYDVTIEDDQTIVAFQFVGEAEKDQA